ncbi:CBS domain protein [Krasilnikovia cinnamomea]|uniref:CBS domain protein n=1 Tax=Krasilnikovia cinnamomea TaxID=349313 RepID=A0A4Q7ZR96_9ACTN|nr:CBS domain-containing protein [Krasilnikovia cinnamomea]RZU53668.1 CBS domain protein [Krasilnikovia cinnamomea]
MPEQVRELMAVPITVPADTTLSEAAELMRDADIGNLVIADGGRPHGIVTDRDIVIHGIADHRSPDATTVGDICTNDLATVGPDAPVERAAQLMRETAVWRLPVVDGDRVVGVVALSDLSPDPRHPAAA